jgi:hypothetical protein
MIAKSLSVVALVAIGTIAYLTTFAPKATSNPTSSDALTIAEKTTSDHRNPGLRLQPRINPLEEANASDGGGITLFLQTDIGPLAVQRN